MKPLETLPETQTVGEPKPSDETTDILFLVLCGSSPLLEAPPIVLAAHAELVVTRGQEVSVSGPASAMRLTLPDPHISDPHCRLLLSNGVTWIEDLQSRNGTFVDGAPVRQAEITDGAVITLGRTALLFRRERTEVIEAMPPPGELPSELHTWSPLLGIAFRRLAHIAKTGLPVFFAGETGTGKEVSARALHTLSGRRGAFVAINCGALPEHLIESELFGYKRGAFSGALSDRKGLVRAAQEGTLFLDEVGDLPTGAQVKLLRVLQERVVIPLGASEPEPVNFRLVTATHRDLHALVAAGTFRSDLWSRLRGFEVRLPNFRERREDTGMLIGQLLRRHGGPGAAEFRFDRRAVDLLLAHDWPLNIRELERLIEIAVNLALPNREIRGDMIQPLLAKSEPSKAPVRAKLEPTQIAGELHRLLKLHQGNVAAVARELGHTRMQIHRWMKRFGLSPQDFRKEP